MEKSFYPYPEFFTTGITRIGMNAGTYRLNLSTLESGINVHP